MTRPLLAFDEVGAGEPVLLLHAFPLDGRMWRPQRELTALASRCRLIIPDLRGFGRSAGAGEREGDTARSLDDHADDVAALLDSLGVAKAGVVGLSMGGYIA